VAAKGRVEKGAVVVPSEAEANTLHNKGAFGAPQSGGSLKLDLLEALYLVEQNRLVVQGEDAGSLLRLASAAEAEFEIRYIVYRDLRGRTFVVKPSSVSDFNVYARGAMPGRAPSTHLVRCASERGALDVGALLADVDKAKKHQKILLVALVDEEGDLTYYEATEADLSASVPKAPRTHATATLLDDRVVVLDPDERKALFAEGYFGRDLGMALQLSLPEALYLAEAGRLRVTDAEGRKEVAPDALAAAARRVGIMAQSAGSVEEALDMVRALELAPAPRVLITGSLYLAGAVLAANGTPPR
jgi:tRNA-intron endonuclease